jgi:hypothetical protein
MSQSLNKHAICFATFHKQKQNISISIHNVAPSYGYGKKNCPGESWQPYNEVI